MDTISINSKNFILIVQHFDLFLFQAQINSQHLQQEIYRLSPLSILMETPCQQSIQLEVRILLLSILEIIALVVHLTVCHRTRLLQH